MSSNDLSSLRVFVIESPNPIDMLQGRAEGPTIQTVGSLIGHEVATITVYSRQQLKEACRYIASISKRPQREAAPGRRLAKLYDAPLCIHISAHGNEDGIAIGQKTISWKALAGDISPIGNDMKQYYGKVIFILSACGAGGQTLTDELAKIEQSEGLLDIPSYIFVTCDCTVAWQDAAVAWTVFYHQLPNAKLDKRSSIQEILDRVRLSCGVNLRYYRWDEKGKKYKKWQPSEPV